MNDGINLSRWCAADTIEVGILREDFKTWDTVPSSGHDWCQNERWHDEYHGKDPGCCAGPEERESWACECGCHAKREALDRMAREGQAAGIYEATERGAAADEVSAGHPRPPDEL